MKFVLSLLVLFIAAPALFGQSYRCDTWTVTVPYGGSSGFNAQIRSFDASNTELGSADPNSSMSGATTITGIATTRGARWYRVAGRRVGSFGAWTPTAWQSSYQVGGTEPQTSSTGGYNASGSPTDGNGNPANPLTGASAPITYYAFTIYLSNNTKDLIRYEVEVRNSTTTQLLDKKQFVVSPGPDLPVTLTYSVPFSYTVKSTVLVNKSNGDKGYMASGNALQSGNGTPQTTAPPTSVADTLASGGSSGGSANGSGAMTAGSTTGGTDPTAVANQARPGTTEGNADARQTELRGELQRVATATSAGANLVSGAVGDGVEKLNNTLKGGDGVTTGFDQGDAVGTADSGATGFLSGLSTRISNLKDAVSNLANALGLGASVGQVAPSWTISLYGKSTTVSLAGVDFSFVRAITLWAISLGAVWQAIGIVRGTMADES